MTPQVLVVGGGMITHDQILPSLLHLRDTGVISKIDVVASRVSTVKTFVTRSRTETSQHTLNREISLSPHYTKS